MSVGIYVYCVVPRDYEPPPGLTGLEGSAVEGAAVSGLGVWISRIDRPQPSVSLFQQHNEVIEAAVSDQVTPVPLRFGQWLDNEAGLRAALAEKAELYDAKLQQFAGCLEFGLRFLDPEAESEARVVHPDANLSGTQYMQALAASNRLAEQKRVRGDQVRAQVSRLLGDLVRAEQEEQANTPHAVLTLAHLVARSAFDEYRARARALRAELPALRLLVSGPWPPYSFAA